MKRATDGHLRKPMPIFDPEAYYSAEDQINYIHDLILAALHKRKITSNLLSMNELTEIIKLA